jgi:hypothetical protein
MRTTARIAALAAGVALAGAGCGSDGPPKPVTGPAGQAEIEEVSGASGDPAKKGKGRSKPADQKESSKTNVE